MADRIGSWDVVRTLGVGTVGTVYEVRDTETGQRGALKILRPDVSKDETVLARFEREIAILEKLSHPNIVNILDSGQHQGQLYYVMELVEGTSLRDVLDRTGRLDWKDVIEIGWQICSALQHVHNQGIVHRDLKPANLFLSNSGEVKLGDFGIALDTGAAELTATGLTVGTYAFMSPEQIRGDRSVAAQADLYALGCLIFRMLTGHNPYEGDNFAQIFDQHLHSPIPSVQSYQRTCPEALDDIARSLLAKSPEDRPYNARAVQGRLAEVLLEWDEEEGRALMRRPATWAIDPRKPILSNLIRTQTQTEVSVSWLKIATLGVVLIVFVSALAILAPG